MAGDENVGIRVKIKEAARAVTELGLVQKAMSGVSREAAKSNAELSKMSTRGFSQFSGLSSAAAVAAKSVGYVSLGLGTAAGAAAYFGLKTASGLEQANIAFTTLLGSQQKASQFTTQLQ